MIDWIEKNLDPPGLDKKNRFGLFSTIAKISSHVHADAVKAHNAHFPYLADVKKLEEHGKALRIPHLPYDTPAEYRNRVAAASFYLMKAGERGFMMNHMDERFKDRYQVVEKFLRLHIKITELTDEERIWTYSFFDFLIDPAILLDVSELFNFREELISKEKFFITLIPLKISVDITKT